MRICCIKEDLNLIDEVFGKGTLGERTEKGFKCNNCDEELDLDEIIFDEVFLVHTPEKVRNIEKVDRNERN